ncbi:MAG TPA: phage terminase small subunit P27 family [Paludibacteraceae bacterium]|nr:phage terminase small subunit P27 family [Paludibacteraceae bacterium]
MNAGRKSLPNEIKKLRGTDQPCRVKETIDVPKVGDISQVINVSKLKVLKTKRAKQIFKEKANQLIALQILTEIDFEQLAIYAHSLDTLFDCIDNITASGKFSEVHDENGRILRFIQNPYLKLYQDMVQICSKIGSEFGFSPVSRMKLHAKPEEKDPLQELMKQFGG